MTSLDDRLNALDDAQRERLRSRLQTLSAGHGHGAPRFSLFFFLAAAHGRDARRQYELMTDCARFADENGFEAIWVPERHFDPFGAPYPSPSVLAAALAATTKRLQIRAGSVVLPLHDPIRVAEDWAVIDNLSGGRAAIALASGWHPNDFVFAPDAFDKRKQVLVEHMKTVRTLFAGEEISRTDGSGHEITLRTYPRPVQAQIPMWITSTSSVQTWQTGAEHGLNVLTGLVDQSLEDLQQNAAVYRDCLREVSRDPGSYSITAMVHTFIGKPGDDVREIVREPMTDYLRAHLNLYAKFARTQDLNIDVDTITDADRDALARFGFERYYKSHGLFGSPEQALPMVRRMAAAGVDEIACLVDFGLPAEIVLSHLEDLARLQALAKAELPVTADPQTQLARLWERSIGRSVSAVAGSDFFELGGASLTAMRLCAAIEREFGVRMTLRNVFDHPQLADQLAFIAAAPRVAARPSRRTAQLPLTLPQRWFWQMQQAIPEAAFFNQVLRIELDGTIDRTALTAALQDIQNRHGALQVTISGEGADAVQTVHRSVDLALTRMSCDPQQLGAEASQAEQEECGKPFDLSTEVPLRVRLIDGGADAVVVLVTTHHIAFDGWSRRVLMEDLIACYTARLDGREAPPAEAGDYAVMLATDEERRRDGEWAAALDAWREALSGTPADLTLAGAAASDRGDYRTTVRTLRIEPGLAAEVSELARAWRVTPFTVLLTGFMITVAAMSGAGEGRVALQVANRAGGDRDGVIGALANTVLVRVPLETGGQTRLGEAIHPVQAAAARAYEFQHVPFEHVLGEIGDSIDPAAVLQVCFALHDEAPGYLAPGCRIRTTLAVSSGPTLDPTPAELVLELRAADGGYDGWLTFKSQKYPAAIVDDLIRRYLGALADGRTQRADPAAILARAGAS